MSQFIAKGATRKKPGKVLPCLSFVSFVVFVVFAVSASAHRLDEYLQATRIGIGPDRVDLELDLTPGVSVARQVFAWIDRDADGGVSVNEGMDYGRAVIGSMKLEVDGHPRSLVLTRAQIPGLAEMSQGIGTIRLTAAAETPPASSGRHRLVFRNTYRPEMSVYLVNALVPASTGITIAGQTRDPLQRETAIDYRVAPAFVRGAGTSPAATLLMLAVGLTALIWSWTRRWRASQPMPLP